MTVDLEGRMTVQGLLNRSPHIRQWAVIMCGPPVSLLSNYEVQCCRFPLMPDRNVGRGHKLQALQQEPCLCFGHAIGELALQPRVDCRNPLYSSVPPHVERASLLRVHCHGVKDFANLRACLIEVPKDQPMVWPLVEISLDGPDVSIGRRMPALVESVELAYTTVCKLP